MLIAIALTLTLAPGQAPPDDCASCSPEGAIERAAEIFDGLRFQLPRPDDGATIYGLMAAAELAETGDTAGALELALYAAARCAEHGSGVCGEAFALVGALTVAAAPDDEAGLAVAAGYLSLVDPVRVSRAVCSRTMLLRFQIARHPWSAEPAWADACGALGRAGELGYRAARAALARGDLDDAAIRIRRLRTHAPERAIRATYLQAALEVASGQLELAEERFVGIASLGPSESRSEAEDDARSLAALQVARLHRLRDDPAAALEWYQRVPARTPGRPDALLEGTVVAAHIGQLGTARLYMEALKRYPSAGLAVERERVGANLAVVDGDEATAMAAFRELSKRGRQLRVELGEVEAQVLSRLREDPSLDGLLDPGLAGGFFALEDSLAQLDLALVEAAAQLEALSADPAQSKVEGELARADAYLARAERDIGITGDAAQRRAASLRVELDLETARLAGIREAKVARVKARRAELEAELLEERTALGVLERAVAAELEALRGTLIARASEVVENLEMSEEIGELELVWRRKLKSAAELRRIREEYDRGLADLLSDTGVQERR